MDCDDLWLAELQAGQPTAFERLVVQFERPLYRYFLGVHGDQQLAGEQSADCFAELTRALPKMRGGVEQLRPFVFAVARNVLRRSWPNARPEPILLDDAHELASTWPDPTHTVEQRDELGRVLAAIETLDSKAREVVLLRCIEELPLADVARIVGEPLGTVKSRLHRARQRLDALLNTPQR